LIGKKVIVEFMDAVVQVAFSMVQAGCPTAVLQSAALNNSLILRD
jgi:hypothetical protein